MSGKEREAPTRRLIDHLAGAAELGPPIALLATSFDLNPEFFEIDYLPSLLRLPAWDDRRVRSRIQLEGELARMSSVALLTEARRFQGRPRSLRVDVRPASARDPGVLHAKITLLVHQDTVRLLVASANLTTSGYRENREVALTLSANAKDPEAGALIRQALEGIEARLAPWWSPAADKAVAAARAVLDAIKAPKQSADEAFVWGGGVDPVWKQVLASWPAGEQVQRIQIVSPFWSDEDGSGPLASLVRALRQRDALDPKAEAQLITDAQSETATSYRPCLPRSYRTFDARTLGIKATAFAAKPQVDEEDVGRDDLRRERRLHAKVLVLHGRTVSVAYAGSANFTTPGWGFGPPSSANIEAGVVMVRRNRGRAQLAALIPPTIGAGVPLNGAAEGALFVPSPDEQELAFPAFLRSAELRVSEVDRQRLELVLLVTADRAPVAWSIALQPEAAPVLVLTGANATRLEHRVALTREQLHDVLRQQVLYVRWPDPLDDAPARYPVNVAADAREVIPFGDPDAFPGENELVAFYQGRIAWEDVFPMPQEGPEFDGEAGVEYASGVDTSKILSYQMRSFVEALHGLRAALREAMIAEGTMRLAIRGPISPIALGRLVHAASVTGGRSPTAAAFQLAELIACVSDASSWDAPEVLRNVWSAACAETLAELRVLLDAVRAQDPRLGNATAFDAYARAVAAATPLGGAR